MYKAQNTSLLEKTKKTIVKTLSKLKEIHLSHQIKKKIKYIYILSGRLLKIWSETSINKSQRAYFCVEFFGEM